MTLWAPSNYLSFNIIICYQDQANGDSKYKPVNWDCMASLVCCMIELQLPRGFEDEAFPRPLDVQRRVVVMEGQVKVHLSLSCLFFLMQELFPAGWAPLEILLCVDNGF